MRQILYSDARGTFDISTEHGKAAAFGRPQATPTIMTDESGEIVCAYNHPSEIERNTQLIKSIKEKYPNVPLRKAVGFYEQELLLKSQQEKAEMMLKSKQPAAVSKPKTSRPGWEKIDRTLAKLDAMIARAG